MLFFIGSQSPLDTLIQNLGGAGILAQLDQLCVTQATEAESLRNLVNPTTFAVNTGCAFTANRGFTGGSARYISTGITPGFGGYKCTRALNTLFAYQNIREDTTLCNLLHTYDQPNNFWLMSLASYPDRQAQDTSAPNLITNGAFDTDLSGWTETGVTGGGYSSWQSGRMRMGSTTTSSTVTRYQAITTVPGEYYDLDETITGDVANCYSTISNTIGGPPLGAFSSFFKAENTTTYIYYKYVIGASFAEVDQVSVRLNTSRCEGADPNSGFGAVAASAPHKQIGFFCAAARNSGLQMEVRLNNTVTTQATTLSGSHSIHDLVVLGANSGGVKSGTTASRVSCWGIGGELSAVQTAYLYQEIQAYMVAIGANA